MGESNNNAAIDPHDIYIMANSFGSESSRSAQELGSHYRSMAGTSTLDDILWNAPSAVLAAFALELLLKTLIVLESGQGAIKREHGIVDLLKLLDAKTFARIKDKYNESMLSAGPQVEHVEFEDAAQHSSDAFMYFRYFYEKIPRITKGWSGHDITTAVHQVILEMKPEWKQV